jgi:hypothetical protein
MQVNLFFVLVTERWTRGFVNISAISTNGSITRCSEREAAVLSSRSEFLKTSKQSPLESFETELFINETEQLPAIWD